MQTTILYHNFLRQITGEEQLERSLDWLIPEFLDLKINFLAQKKQEFETKYAMSLAEYEVLVLGGEQHEWEEEQIVMEWHKTVLLLEAYLKRREQWVQMNSRDR
jgi:hypothetical protein